MNKLKDAHYFPLPSQGNIYTFTKLQLTNNTNKLLVATLKREVFCFEYSDTASGVLFPTAKEISFTYIPSGAEIISIDAFNKSDENNEFVIGITIIKNSSDLNSLETYLNIYSESEESKEFNIESIAQNCLNVELNFIPYHLTHTKLVTWDSGNIKHTEVVFILSGSDSQIHVYRENTTTHFYKEIDKKEIFPEFSKPPSIVIWIDIFYFNDDEERVTAFGCECGYVRLCRINAKKNEIIFNHATRFDNFITHLRIYSKTDKEKQPIYLGDTDVYKEENLILNLVVTNSILPPVFFSDILTYGMKKCGALPRCEVTNVFTCLEVADVDFDGQKEIIIGNSTEELQLYKFKDKGWCLTEQRKIASPVFGVIYMDITGDGVKELIVLSMKGVYILQHDFNHLHEILEGKLEDLSIPNVTIPQLEENT